MADELRYSEWSIKPDGMFCRSYWIDASRYNEIASYVAPWLSDWLLHIAKKSGAAWDLEAFIDAFRRAMLAAGVSPEFDWDRSVAYARQHRKKNDEYARISEEMYPKVNGEFKIISLPEMIEHHRAVECEMARRRALH